MPGLFIRRGSIDKYESNVEYKLNIIAIEHRTEHRNCMLEELEISFPACFDYVPPVRNLISSIVRAKGFSAKDSFRIEAIVDELCNNSIEFGSPDLNSNVGVLCKIDDEAINIVVSDKGGLAEDINILKERVIEQMKYKEKLEMKRGRGLQIVKMLADELMVHVLETGETEVRIIKWKKSE